MTLWQAVAAGILTALTVAALKDTNSRMAPYALAAGGGMLALWVFSRVSGPIATFAELVRESPLREHASVLLRGIGITYAAKLGADTCRDLGAEGVANRVEFCGRAELILLALPYVTKLISLAVRLVEEGVG
ncbi:MAG: SpoIIIAC/SpoIIIAD family protein [Clostridia bacterium]|nr:SpoIIIAC/SpoIIIAD family protein [Clostridia bacterium]MDY6184550.1 SpoIIIAC/SpoIIIAD family protein [Eubacteriales bacterium]